MVAGNRPAYRCSGPCGAGRRRDLSAGPRRQGRHRHGRQGLFHPWPADLHRFRDHALSACRCRLWADRFQRIHRGAFNSVETYAFWNYNEPQENQSDFRGEKDFGAYLQAAQDAGLYAICRVGPYVCAEWDSGGYPIWLKFKPPFAVRAANPAFLALNDHWYAQILPIVAAHQIHKGGNVILVQLENEHPHGWGIVNSPYFLHLRAKAVELGIEVPMFMSGLNHGAGPDPNPDNAHRQNPWMTTNSGRGGTTCLAPWTGIATASSTTRGASSRHGGNGHNYYMLHGGTDFETENDDEVAASYDYGAAIGQAGDLRPIYYAMKQVNLFAASFPAILENSSNAAAAYKDFVRDAEVSGVRQGPAGTIVFFKNPRGTVAEAVLKGGDRLRLRAGEIAPVVLKAPLVEGITIADSAVRIVGVAQHHATTTVVLQGLPGDSGRLNLAFAGT